MPDWNSFTVFEGKCVLNKKIFSAKTDFKFLTWVRQLRTDPLQGGIPEERVGDVISLLDKFFPVDARPLLVAFDRPNPLDNSVFPCPETVSYGSSKININDGPSALGYVFSIAASNAASPRTYSNYAVPLLAIYARCLYLAYVSGEGKEGLQGVPYMANCMYTALAGNNPAFHLLLGSTYKTIGRLTASKIQMMNRFRRSIVDAGLKQFKPPRTLRLEPRVHTGAVLALKKYLRGVIPKNTGTNLWIPGTGIIASPTPLVCNSTAKRDFNTFANLWADQWLTANQTTITPLELSDAISAQALTAAGGPSIAKAIETALGQIIDKRWEEGYNRAEAFVDLLPLMRDFYIQVYIPHMFPAQVPDPKKPPPKKRRLSQSILKPDVTKPQVSMPSWAASVEAEVDAILIAQKDLILDKLDHLYSWISTGAENLSDGGPDRPRYGRCAETHPLVGLIPTYVTERSPIRGFAVQVFRFNDNIMPDVVTCNNLSLDFTSDTMNAFHLARAKDPVFRLPCENCRVLLPAMDAPIGEDAYDADLKALNPFNFYKMK